MNTGFKQRSSGLNRLFVQLEAENATALSSLHRELTRARRFIRKQKREVF